MKKAMSYIAATALVLTFTACGSKDKEVVTDNQVIDQTVVDGAIENNEGTETSENTEVKPEENKVEKTPEQKPSETKPVENKPVENKPAETKPTEEPKVETTTTSNSIANTLLKDFKAKAASAKDVESLANSLLENEVIEFMGATVEVQEGYLNGFDGEIKGFKKGAMFAPMIGSIPFVGYVFELDNASNVDAFINTLKSSANLRWNICTQADEMVTGSVGNRVFFVMSPTEME